MTALARVHDLLAAAGHDADDPQTRGPNLEGAK